MQTDRIIIIGAGIAGLSLAIQLAENNSPCVVLEERNSFGGVTSGVRISAQGVRILEKMNIRHIGENTQRTIMHFGNMVTDFALRNTPGVSPAIMVTRLAVYEKLMEKARLLGVEMITGFKLLEASKHSGGVEVISAAGQHIAGRLLVGADGVGSTVRKILNPGQSSGKAYAGYLGVGLITPSDAKIEMTLYQYPGNQVGLASIGRKSESDVHNNVFLWTHLYMTGQEAKAMTDDRVLKILSDKSGNWHPQLKKIFEMSRTNSHTVLAYGPVYNGKIPADWFNENMILIGDAAHPYGPGGQGISMALKDAEALCEMILSGDIGPEAKEKFHKHRAEEARKWGESAEARNKPERQIKTHRRLLFRGVAMKVYHFFNGGVLESF